MMSVTYPKIVIPLVAPPISPTITAKQLVALHPFGTAVAALRAYCRNAYTLTQIQL